MKRSAQPNVKTVQMFLGTEFMHTHWYYFSCHDEVHRDKFSFITETEFVMLMVVIHASLTSSVMNIT